MELRPIRKLMGIFSNSLNLVPLTAHQPQNADYSLTAAKYKWGNHREQKKKNKKNTPNITQSCDHPSFRSLRSWKERATAALRKLCKTANYLGWRANDGGINSGWKRVGAAAIQTGSDSRRRLESCGHQQRWWDVAQPRPPGWEAMRSPAAALRPHCAVTTRAPETCTFSTLVSISMRHFNV